jgi:transcriptional regulator with XRE-family HTH domain
MPDLLTQLAGQSNEAIGLRAQLRREMLGLSQTDLAERRGVSLDTVKRWEEGKRNFDADLLLWLCDVLQCSIHYLLDTPDETGNGAVEHLLIMYWRALPEPQAPGIDWTREGLLATIRNTVMGKVQHG